MPADGAKPILFHDPGRSVYKKLVLRERRLVGAVLYGETRDGPWYFDLITGHDADPADLAGALLDSAAIDAVLPPPPALSGGVIP